MKHWLEHVDHLPEILHIPVILSLVKNSILQPEIFSVKYFTNFIFNILTCHGYSPISVFIPPIILLSSSLFGIPQSKHYL